MIYEIPGLDAWLAGEWDDPVYEPITYDDWSDDFDESLDYLISTGHSAVPL